MAKKKQDEILSNKKDAQVDEQTLFKRVSEIIETRKSRAGSYANREVTLMYWEVGRYGAEPRPQKIKKTLTT